MPTASKKEGTMHGVYTALVTPMNSLNELDLGQFKKNLLAQADAGITGVIVSGTTGESPTLSLEEKKTLILTAVETLKDTPVKVIAGTGSNDTKSSVALSQWASSNGVDGLILVCPYYNKPSQLGLEKHFLSIADGVSCEIMLYNVPGRTGVRLTAPTLGRLAQHPNITTLKESTGDVTSTSEIIDHFLELGVNLDVLCGDDSCFLPFLSIGAVGLVSVASNLIPRPLVQMHQFFQSGNLTQALALHQRYFPLFRDLFIESNPVPLKWCLEALGQGTSHFRPPLGELQTSSIDQLKVTLNRCGMIDAQSMSAIAPGVLR